MSKVPLKDLCKPNEIGKYGIPASAENFDESKVRYLRISDIDDYGNLLNDDLKSVSSEDIDKYILDEGDLVVARTGNSTGRTYYHENKNGKLAFAGFLIKYGLDPNKINPKYLKYYTISNEYKQWVKNLSVGSTRGNINAQTFANCLITIPERKQQDDLVNVLSSLDAKIELNNRINAQLEAMAKTIYDYWFVQFDFPYSPPSEGLGVVKPYKSSGGKMVYNEELKREIPEGWEVKSIEDCCKIVDCLHSKKPDSKYEDEKFFLLQLENLLDNGLIDTSWKYYVTQDDYSKWTSRIEVKEHDILITNAGRVAATTQVPKELNTGIGRNITAVRPINISPTYLFLSFCGFDIIKQIRANTDSGAFFSSFNVKGIKRLQFLIPPNEVEKNFENIVYPIRRKREINLNQNQQLSQLRDWLLPMLMNGQVTVKDAYAMVDEQLSMAAEEQAVYKKSI